VKKGSERRWGGCDKGGNRNFSKVACKERGLKGYKKCAGGEAAVSLRGGIVVRDAMYRSRKGHVTGSVIRRIGEEDIVETIERRKNWCRIGYRGGG